MRIKITEEDITESICHYLSLFRGSQLNRITPGGFFKNGRMRKHKSKHVKKGVSDIQFIYQGKFYVFEVKTPKEYKYTMKYYGEILSTPKDFLVDKKKHLKEQIEYIEGVRRNGFIGEFVCSIEMVKERLERK